MISNPQAFVRQCCDVWNRHDIEAMLAHFAEDILFTSPVAYRMTPETDGAVRGNTALRSYWQRALAEVPNIALINEL